MGTVNLCFRFGVRGEKMKITCEYCNSMFNDTLEKCPNCGAPNKNVRRSTIDQPTTIEELKEWYASKGLPPEHVTRFFIGVDYRNPKAFGIYRDENTGNFVVYKNKADGTRAVRYEGTDEAYAVNELFTRLKQEILEQKSNNLKKNSSGYTQKRRSKGCLSQISSAGIVFFIILTILGLAGYLKFSEMPSKIGYYACNDIDSYKGKIFYHYIEDKYSWAVFDEEKGEWKKTSVYPAAKFERWKNGKNYFLSEEYDSSYGGEDFKNSFVYIDSLNGFNVDKGYYSYNDDVYYHMKNNQDEGWYVYDDDDGDWDSVFFLDVPADLKHQTVANDFWYTPDWDSETQITDFEETEEYIDYQEELQRQAERQSTSSDSGSSSSDNDYSWDSGDSWDSGTTDWGSDW